MPGKRECAAKLASKEKWVDERKIGFKYASPTKKSSTPGDSYATVAQKLPAAFPPMGTYPAKGNREKISVEGLKEHRNIQTSPAKKGMGGYVGHPGVLMNPFPKFESGDAYDAMEKKKQADNAAHKAAQAAVDEKCRYLSRVRGVGLFDSQPTVDAPKCLSHDPACIVRDKTPLEAAGPKERAKLIAATKPWEASGDKTWRYATPKVSGPINKFPVAEPDKFEDHVIREAQTPLRRMGWHRHVAAGVISDGVAERKPFKPSTGVGHKGTSSSIMFRGMRA